MKWVYILLFVVVFIILTIFGFPLPYFINNYRLDSFANQFEKIPLPAKTEKISMLTKNFGNLGTCSKHGDYYAEFKIASELSLAQLEAFYNQFHVQVPEINNAILTFLFRGLGTNGPVHIYVEKVEGARNKYIVYAFDPDYWHNDFRCW